MNQNNKIPKIIHYCWFGGKQKPEKVEKIIEGWKNILVDYEFKEWNEDTFDLDKYQYTREAYDQKKYAFVTDVVRLYALKKYGGIYMDTDVELIKSLDAFLHHSAFTGCENSDMCVTGLMASMKNGIWVSCLLKDYDTKVFINKDGTFNMKTNTVSITELTINNFGWEKMNKNQDLGEIYIYSSDYFCAKDWENGKITITENTHAIHHFSGTWKTPTEKIKNKTMNFIKKSLISIFGQNAFDKVNNTLRKNKQDE